MFISCSLALQMCSSLNVNKATPKPSSFLFFFLPFNLRFTGVFQIIVLLYDLVLTGLADRQCSYKIKENVDVFIYTLAC